jgi:hypothetical protein
MSGSVIFGPDPGPGQKKILVPVPEKKNSGPGRGEKKILVPVPIPVKKNSGPGPFRNKF